MAKLLLILIWYAEYLLVPLIPTALSVIVRGIWGGWSLQCVSSAELSLSVAGIGLLALFVTLPKVKTTHGADKARALYKTYVPVIALCVIMFTIAVICNVELEKRGHFGMSTLQESRVILEQSVEEGGKATLEESAIIRMASIAANAADIAREYDRSEKIQGDIRKGVLLLSIYVVLSAVVLRQRYRVT